MISTTTSYVLTGGAPPYSLAITTDSTCATVTHTDTSDGLFQVTTSAFSVTCFPVTLTFAGVDSVGCPIDLNVETIQSPCDDFSITPISQVDNGTTDIILQVQGVSPSCPSLEFDWVYNDLLFEVISVTNGANSSTIQLRPVGGATFPANTVVGVNVTDCRGCTATSSFNYGFCTPDAQNFPLTLLCMDTNYSTPSFMFPTPTSTCAFELERDSLQTTLPTGWVLQEQSTPQGPQYRIIAPLSTPGGTYIGFYSFTTTDSVVTDQGTITLTVSACDEGNTIVISSLDFYLDCDDVSGDVAIIPIEDLVTTSTTTSVDWTTWTLVTPPTPASPNIELGFDTNGVRSILYTIPNPIVSDSFAWTVCDTSGNCANAAVVTTIDCPEDPLANDDDACVSCGETVTIPVLDNDLANGSILIPSTLTIVTPPNNGSALVSSGSIIYSPFTNFSGTDSLQYTVQNAQGALSNIATVTLEVACAGDGGTIIVCS